jgi:hypothetical protein
MDKIKTHRDLKVFQLSFEAGMEIFRMSKLFPKEEFGWIMPWSVDTLTPKFTPH